MQTQFQETADALRIQLTGDLIGGVDAMKFSTSLRETLADKKLQQVEIDASNVGFVNSSGLGMLIAARQTAMEHGAHFSLQQPGEQLMSLLNVTKLTEILGVSNAG